MTETKASTPAAKKPPKGGRKGGTIFPRVGLKKALEYSEKLVRKTHTGPQPKDAIFRGVFENVGSEGDVRASALKQYGLLEATAEGFKASDLARNIVAALPEEQATLKGQAFLSSKLFKKIFDTYNGDTVSTSKIRQSALGLKVHLDSVDECVRLFIESAVLVGLAAQDGDSLLLVQSSTIVPVADARDDESAVTSDEGEIADAEDGTAAIAGSTEAQDTANRRNGGGESSTGIPRTEKAAVAVNLNVDSSSDPDKLEKQLKLLRQYGVI
jgi:hypothetical protein